MPPFVLAGVFFKVFITIFRDARQVAQKDKSREYHQLEGIGRSNSFQARGLQLLAQGS
jgi:hypothetical protein